MSKNPEDDFDLKEDNINKSGKFFMGWMPEVLDSRLTPSERLFVFWLRFRAGASKHTNVKQTTAAEDFGVDPSTVKRWVDKLTGLGILSCQKLGYGRSSVKTLAAATETYGRSLTHNIYDLLRSGRSQDDISLIRSEDKSHNGLIDEPSNGLIDEPSNGLIDEPTEVDQLEVDISKSDYSEVDAQRRRPSLWNFPILKSGKTPETEPERSPGRQPAEIPDVRVRSGAEDGGGNPFIPLVPPFASASLLASSAGSANQVTVESSMPIAINAKRQGLPGGTNPVGGTDLSKESRIDKARALIYSVPANTAAIQAAKEKLRRDREKALSEAGEERPIKVKKVRANRFHEGEEGEPSSVDMELLFGEQMEKRFPKLSQLVWYPKQKKLAKMLLAEIGKDKAFKLITFLFANWTALRDRLKFDAKAPTIEFVWSARQRFVNELESQAAPSRAYTGKKIF